MRVLAFRHIEFEDLGLIEPALASRGIEHDYADLYQDGAAAPDASGYDGLIFMGGPMSVNDPLPYLTSEMGIIERAMTAGTPVLGICLGAQLIAKTLGARVYRNAQREIGWFDIELTQAGESDPILAGIRRVETVFHWHGETFDLPQGASLLARSERTEHQAFRYAKGIYGLQFHLEVTTPMIVDWCVQDRNCGDMRELSEPPDPWIHRDRLDQVARIVFGQWCDLLKPRATYTGD